MVGNRESGPTVKDTAAVAYEHNSANQMLKGRKFDYGYDDLGNQQYRYLSADHSKFWQYTWDVENRLRRAALTLGGQVVRTLNFKYDPFGRRIEKQVIDTESTVITSYVYDGEDIVFTSVSDGTATTTSHYVHGPGIDEPLAMVTNGLSSYYHADGLGSIIALTDAAKNVVQRYAYDSFGMVTAENPEFANFFTYTAREWDRELGLYYYRARYYDPMEGRFVSRDPIGFAGGDVNVYGYVGNDPLNWVDPWGLWGSDIHSGRNNPTSGTYKWAIDVGVSSKIAGRISFANESVDGGPFGSNGTGWNVDIFGGDQSRHFGEDANVGDSRVRWAIGGLNAAVALYKQGDPCGAYDMLGKGLHSLQDYYAHRDWDTGSAGANAHPAWYDDVNDPRNATALANTETATKMYIESFLRQTRN